MRTFISHKVQKGGDEISSKNDENTRETLEELD